MSPSLEPKRRITVRTVTPARAATSSSEASSDDSSGPGEIAAPRCAPP